MPAKKAPSSREQNKRDAIRVEVPLNGLYMEKFVAYPVWDPNDIEKESWGELIPNDPSSLYHDSESSQLGSQLFEGLDNANIEWKRPSVLFSPFKPVVYRPTNLESNPYDNMDDQSEEGKAAREASIAAYRDLRPLRAVGDEDEATARAAAAKSRVAAATAALTAGGSPGASMGSGTPRRRGQTPTPVPFLMGAFQSALMILSQNQHHIQPGCFAWELIYPQAPNPQGLPIPVINPAGKYAVRLFLGGAFRKVVIDDRLPADSSGRSIFTVTDYKEIWPALLVKAIMKVLTPALEAQIALNPVVTLSTLMCGWTPQILNPTTDELLVYRMLQRVRNASETLVIVATCSDSSARYTTGAISQTTTANLQLLAQESAQSNMMVGSNTSGGGSPSSAAAGDASSRPAAAGMNPSLGTSTNEKDPNSGPHTGTLDALSAGNAEIQVPGLILDKTDTKRETYKNVGLRAYHGYHIVDMRTYGQGFLLRLVCPGANYTGPYSYDSDDWSTDLIDTLGFNPTEHRNPHELAKRWNDFWVPWDQFKDYFSSFIVFRYAADKKSFPYFKNFPAEVTPPDPSATNNNNQTNTSNLTSPASAAASPNPAGSRRGTNPVGGSRFSTSFSSNNTNNAKNDGNVNTSQNIDIPLPPEVTIPKHQKNSVRWVHLINNDAEADSYALITMTGIPAPPNVIQATVAPPPPAASSKATRQSAAAAAHQQAQSAIMGGAQLTVAPPSAQDTENEPQTWSVKVHRFDWNQSQPFCLLKQQSCARGLNQSFHVVLPAGRGTTLRITVDNCPIGCAVAVLSPCEIYSGSEREVFLEGSGIVSGSDAGQYAEHSQPTNVSSGMTTTVASSTSFSQISGEGSGGIGSAGTQQPSQSSFELQGPGQYSDSSALQTATIWFKRHITVKADTTASFVLSTLPKNADLAAHRVQPSDQSAAAGKGKGAKGAAGAQQQDANNANANNNANNANNKAGGAGSKSLRGGLRGNDPLGNSKSDLNEDDENGAGEQSEPLRPISDYANLILVDIENGTTTVDTIGKILNVHLSPNKLGYVIMAVARTPEPYKKGNWKLSYYSTRVFDTFEPKNFEDVVTKSGHYVQNDFRQVFRYNFFFPAANDKGGDLFGPSATIQACLRDDSGQPVPFTLELHHGVQDPAIASAAAAQSAALTGGMSAPSPNKDNSTGSPSEGNVSPPSVRFAASGSQARGGKSSKDDPPEPIPMEVVSTRQASHYAMFEHLSLSAHEKNTPSYYSLVCTLDSEYAAKWEQRRKTQVIEGFTATTEKQSRMLLSQQWTRYQALKRNPGAPLPKELEQSSTIPEVAPGTIIFSVNLHFSNAKYELKEDSSIPDALNAIKQSWGRKEAEERAAAAAAVSGKKATASKKANAKDEQQMADEIAAHFARAKASRERFLSNRKGIFMPYLNEETGQPVLDAFKDPALRFLPMAPTTDYQTYLKDPQRAADAKKQEVLSKALEEAVPVQYAKKLAEETIEMSATVRNSRKTWINHANDALNALWAEVAPNKPIAGANSGQEEVDDKSRRGARGAGGRFGGRR